jgi:hypothetical protein
MELARGGPRFIAARTESAQWRTTGQRQIRRGLLQRPMELGVGDGSDD